MVRSMVGFAGFAIVALIGLKLMFALLGGFMAILGTILWFAFWGWVFYLVLRILSPSMADRIRETIRGKRTAA